MKITTFNPQIVTKDAESVAKIFEDLGFKRSHNPKGIGELYNGPQKSDHCRRKEREHGRIGPTIERKRYHGTQTVQPTV